VAASDARLGNGDQESFAVVVPAKRRNAEVGSGDGRGSLTGEDGKVVLHRLELRDRPAELHAFLCIRYAEIQRTLQRAGHHGCPRQRAAAIQRAARNAGA